MPARFRPLVICYHAVSDEWPHALALPARTIERHVVALLRRGFRPAGAEAVVAGRGRLVHVTFDDAFRSVEAVLPALERLGVPVTVFACTAYADGGRPLDVPELASEAAMRPAELATMGWDTLRRLTDAGVEVGSHTATHAHLASLSTAEIERELRESRLRLEDELRRPCRFLAYPYGEFDERVRRAAEAAGYEAAFALESAERGFDRYALPRVGLYRNDGIVRATLKTTSIMRRSGRALLAARWRRQG